MFNELLQSLYMEIEFNVFWLQYMQYQYHADDD